MLLELDIGQLLDCLESPQLLQAAVTAALEALGVATAAPPPDPPRAAVPARHAPPHRPPAEAKPRQPSQAKVQAAKTKLCKYFIQMGYCKNGDACDFAHGVEDMPQQAWLGLGLGLGLGSGSGSGSGSGIGLTNPDPKPKPNPNPNQAVAVSYTHLTLPTKA